MASERTGAEAVLWKWAWDGPYEFPSLRPSYVLTGPDAGDRRWLVSVGCRCGDDHEGSGATVAEAIQQLIDDQSVTHCPECRRELLHPVPDCAWDIEECAQCYRAAIDAELRATRGW